MDSNLITAYLLLCKDLYSLGISPSNPKGKSTVKFKELSSISKQLIKLYGVEEYSKILEEGSYFTNLWAAHFIMAEENINNETVHRALAIIKEYSNHPIMPLVAEEEKYWLGQYYKGKEHNY